jgi:hypothetical protein
MNFESTPEYIQSLKMRPACNLVLGQVFGVDDSAIKRFENRDNLFILDQQFHIDVVLTLNNNSTLTGQEKTLSNHFYKFRTFTMEFYQNRFTKEKGEFFKIASQFYLHGYSDSSGENFVEWYIFNVLLMLNWLRGCSIKALEDSTRPSTSKASFLIIPYDKIPSEFILAKHKP